MTEKLIRLIAPAGCDEAASHGRKFPVHADGCIYVPAEAARHFLHRGGFALARPAPEPTIDREKCYAPGSIEAAAQTGV